MNNNIDKLQAWILFGFTCFVAISLAVNAIGALLGRANLAWWHYFTLAASSSLTEASLQRDQRIMLKRLFGNARKKGCRLGLPIILAHPKGGSRPFRPFYRQ